LIIKCINLELTKGWKYLISFLEGFSKSHHKIKRKQKEFLK